MDAFQTRAKDAEQTMIEIAEAGQLGKGVFATADIPKYTLLGEYLGELLPADCMVDATDLYIFTIEDEFVISKSSPLRRVPRCDDSQGPQREANLWQGFKPNLGVQGHTHTHTHITRYYSPRRSDS